MLRFDIEDLEGLRIFFHFGIGNFRQKGKYNAVKIFSQEYFS